MDKVDGSILRKVPDQKSRVDRDPSLVLIQQVRPSRTLSRGRLQFSVSAIWPWSSWRSLCSWPQKLFQTHLSSNTHRPFVENGFGQRMVRGVTEQQGLYVVGLPWLTGHYSSIVGGVGVDAGHAAGR